MARGRTASGGTDREGSGLSLGTRGPARAPRRLQSQNGAESKETPHRYINVLNSLAVPPHRM